MFTDENLLRAQELLECIAFFNQKGWSPATSTNYSVRGTNPREIIISRSGVDKSKFALSDLIGIDSDGHVLPAFQKASVKSSAETEIHTALYKKFPEITCVLHTHSVLGTMLSQLLVAEGKLTFEGLEILKGLEGNPTHAVTEVLPIVPNSQTMSEIMDALAPALRAPLQIHGFLIAGHGLYTWGKDIATAKRHIETFEFLFECYKIQRSF